MMPGPPRPDDDEVHTDHYLALALQRHANDIEAVAQEIAHLEIPFAELTQSGQRHLLQLEATALGIFQMLRDLRNGELADAGSDAGMSTRSESQQFVTSSSEADIEPIGTDTWNIVQQVTISPEQGPCPSRSFEMYLSC
jgi:hypothetical protein